MIETFSSFLQNEFEVTSVISPFLTISLNGLIHTDVNLAVTTLGHCLLVFGAKCNLD